MKAIRCLIYVRDGQNITASQRIGAGAQTKHFLQVPWIFLKMKAFKYSKNHILHTLICQTWLKLAYSNKVISNKTFSFVLQCFIRYSSDKPSCFPSHNNAFVYNSFTVEWSPDITNPCYNKHTFPVPWYFFTWWFHYIIGSHKTRTVSFFPAVNLLPRLLNVTTL